jgi:hypothetical protein
MTVGLFARDLDLILASESRAHDYGETGSPYQDGILGCDGLPPGT